MNKEYLIKIDEPRIQETCDAFFKWKDKVSEEIFETAIHLQDIFHDVRFTWMKDKVSKRITVPVQWHED